MSADESVTMTREELNQRLAREFRAGVRQGYNLATTVAQDTIKSQECPQYLSLTDSIDKLALTVRLRGFLEGNGWLTIASVVNLTPNDFLSGRVRLGRSDVWHFASALELAGYTFNWDDLEPAFPG